MEEGRQFLDFEHKLSLKADCVSRLHFKRLARTCAFASLPAVPKTSPRFVDFLGLDRIQCMVLFMAESYSRERMRVESARGRYRGQSLEETRHRLPKDPS